MVHKAIGQTNVYLKEVMKEKFNSSCPVILTCGIVNIMEDVFSYVCVLVEEILSICSIFITWYVTEFDTREDWMGSNSKGGCREVREHHGKRSVLCFL